MRRSADQRPTQACGQWTCAPGHCGREAEALPRKASGQDKVKVWTEDFLEGHLAEGFRDTDYTSL